MKEQKEKLPEILCELTYILNSKEDTHSRLLETFSAMSFTNIEGKESEAADRIKYTLASTGYIEEWLLDKALNKLFDIIGNRINEFIKVLDAFNGIAFIYVAFYAYDDNPALHISKENIDKIALLNAGIGIDAYWYDNKDY